MSGELYNPTGIYRYGSGVNYRAIVALAAGVVVALIGLVVPALRWLYDYAWFVGFPGRFVNVLDFDAEQSG